MHRIKYEVTNLGIDYPDYFQGFGAGCTDYDEAVTGIGDTYNEALSDALTILCESKPVSANQADAIERTEHFHTSFEPEVSASREQYIDISHTVIPHDYVCDCDRPVEYGYFCKICHNTKVEEIQENQYNCQYYYVGIRYTLTLYQKKG